MLNKIFIDVDSIIVKGEKHEVFSGASKVSSYKILKNFIS